LSVESASVNGEAKEVTHALGVPFPVLGSWDCGSAVALGRD
jgi:hypothetical protein